MRFDGVAHLRCWAVDVDLGGATYTIASQPAAVWLLAMAGSYTAIVPGMLADADALHDLILDGAVSGTECLDAARAAIAAAAGTTWWTAVRLARAATDTWIGHDLLLAGVDAQRLSLSAYLAAAYRAATREMAADKVRQLDHELDRPPEGVPAQEWFDEQAAASGFMAALGGQVDPDAEFDDATQ